MKWRNIAGLSIFLAPSLAILTPGCSMKTPLLTKEVLSQRVQGLLGGQDAVTVQAGRLTDFPWQTLCFRRDEVLRLEFQIDGASHRVALPYEAFFVDEGYVANSLENACVTPAELIVVRRKYQGYDGPVEFQSVPAGNGR